MALINPLLVQSAVRIRNESDSVHGTGFGFARPDNYNHINPSKHRAETPEPWRFWWVTCAHVVDGIEENQAQAEKWIIVEVNELGGKGGIASISYPITHYWTRHREWNERCKRLGPISQRNYEPEDAAVDVAVTTAPTRTKAWESIDWWGFPPKTHLTKQMLCSDDLLRQPISEGDGIYIVGFPQGYYPAAKNWPVVRQGVIAQIQPYLQGENGIFLIDGSVFGGNSGGPVVTQIQGTSIGGTAKTDSNSLIGMVSGYKPYETGENADLGIVVPLDTINETIEMALSDSPHLWRNTTS